MREFNVAADGNGFVKRLGGGPGNRALVGDAEDDTLFVFQHKLLRSRSLVIPGKIDQFRHSDIRKTSVALEFNLVVDILD